MARTALRPNRTVTLSYQAAVYLESTNYLNIWSIDLGNGLLGYATFPPGTPLNGIPGNPGTMTDDGVVILYNAFGRTGNLINN
nr:hypothetical protein [Bacteroidota bacterium]